MRLIGAAALLVAGCTSSSNSVVDATGTNEQPAEFQKVTFYVSGMNERLQIL